MPAKPSIKIVYHKWRPAPQRIRDFFRGLKDLEEETLREEALRRRVAPTPTRYPPAYGFMSSPLLYGERLRGSPVIETRAALTRKKLGKVVVGDLGGSLGVVLTKCKQANPKRVHTINFALTDKVEEFLEGVDELHIGRIEDIHPHEIPQMDLIFSHAGATRSSIQRMRVLRFILYALKPGGLGFFELAWVDPKPNQVENFLRPAKAMAEKFGARIDFAKESHDFERTFEDVRRPATFLLLHIEKPGRWARLKERARKHANAFISRMREK